MIYFARALLRPGRFDVEVRVFPPDLKGRKEIIELYLSKVKYNKGEIQYFNYFITYSYVKRFKVNNLGISKQYSEYLSFCVCLSIRFCVLLLFTDLDIEKLARGTTGFTGRIIKY